MHLFNIEKHMYGGNGIVGGHIPLAAGMALSIKYKKENGVVLCFFGDGAIHQGSFHETLNLVRIWDLPIVYICENNQYGMGTDFRRVSSVDDFTVMARSYSIEGKQVDGMDILQVHEHVLDAVEKARKGEPGFLEIKTYRYKGHSMSDPAKYRTKEEVEQYKQQDPIIIFKDKLITDKIITDKDYEDIDMNAKKTCQEAVDFSEQSEEPSLDELYKDVLAQ
jgi:pyruvate dehydrogenase E1 component alpha subunit